MADRKKTKFEKDCEVISEQLGLGDDVLFCEDERKQDPFEDDGCLHVTKNGVRAVFDVSSGQQSTNAIQNERTRKVLTMLKMEKYINDYTLVEEDDEEESDYCEHCGRW